MSSDHIQTAKALGIERWIDEEWGTPLDTSKMAETIIMTQQSKVLHRETEFWTKPEVFVKRMLPVVRIYLKEVGNQLSASTKLLGRAEALKRKGSLGLKWHEMKDAAGIQEACQTVQVRKGVYCTPQTLVERKFVKLLLDYYVGPPVPLQSMYYTLLYLVHQRLEYATDTQNADKENADSQNVARNDLD